MTTISMTILALSLELDDDEVLTDLLFGGATVMVALCWQLLSPTQMLNNRVPESMA